MKRVGRKCPHLVPGTQHKTLSETYNKVCNSFPHLSHFFFCIVWGHLRFAEPRQRCNADQGEGQNSGHEEQQRPGFKWKNSSPREELARLNQSENLSGLSRGLPSSEKSADQHSDNLGSKRGFPSAYKLKANQSSEKSYPGKIPQAFLDAQFCSYRK